MALGRGRREIGASLIRGKWAERKERIEFWLLISKTLFRVSIPQHCHLTPMQYSSQRPKNLNEKLKNPLLRTPFRALLAQHERIPLPKLDSPPPLPPFFLSVDSLNKNNGLYSSSVPCSAFRLERDREICWCEERRSEMCGGGRG